ncbi:MAG: 30S ribosomal protein S21 [Flavobacteriaceae bacterium]|jgi:small subunit ribosomal protein S21
MLKIEVKPGENIDRAIKRYKRKVRDTKQLQKLRSNEFFTKKSIKRREEIAKAKYKEILKRIEDN